MAFPDSWHDSWSQVDQTADPGFFVRCLDATRRPIVRAAYANPAQFFAYLNVKHGDSILEIGCGTGDVLIALADLVRPEGRVVGIDSSRAMVSEARRRARRAEAPVEFLIGDAHCLELPDGTFDHCLATSVLEHLEAPEQALAEMARAARPGGRITVAEPDWDTQVVDAGDIDVTRRVIHFFADSIRHGRIARRLPAMMREAGLTDIHIEAWSSLCSSAGEPMGEWLCQSARRAADAGAITHQQADEWLADLADRDRRGIFLAAFTTFRVSGKKPV